MQPPPVRVRRVLMRQDWLCLTFLHWAFDADAVQHMLPEGLTVETFDGAAWVGLVPFRMRVRAARGPLVPWVSVFPETNLRTYVVAPDGTTGVWFFSLDASRAAAVAVGRAAYRLPYRWARMHLNRDGDVISYRSQRRWLGPGAPATTICVEAGAPLGAISPLDDFLTARFRLFSNRWGGIAGANAEHEPWPLRSAEVRYLDESILDAARLPVPRDAPRVLFSEGVSVRIGHPARVA